MATCAMGQRKDHTPFPNPDAGYVTDHANLLTHKQEQDIESWLSTTEKKKGLEIVVVTIDSIKDYPGTPNENIESFATALFNTWGIGNMPTNDGILLLIAWQDRKARIELGAGYGRIHDRDANRIMQRKIIPQLRKNRYAKGITAGTRAIIKEFGGINFVSGWVMILIPVVILVLILAAISLFRNGKRGWGWVCLGLIIILVLLFILLLKTAGESLASGSGHDGDGFGGGFGGGSSGGGGTTGSW